MRIAIIRSMVACIVVAILLSCSTGPVDVSDGGTDYPNTKTIAGVIVASDGDEAPNTMVQLIAEGYNPLRDEELPDSLIDTTGDDGAYNFTITDSGIYNIQAIDLNERTRWLKKDIAVFDDTVHVPRGILSEPGVINIILPDTVDTGNGYIYIEGTDIWKKISDVILLSGNHYSIILDSVPASRIPDLRYTTDDPNSKSMLISDTTEVIANDTVIAGTTEGNLKPLWRFSLIVGVTEETVQYYGDLDSIGKLIADHIEKINNKFNDPEVFNGVLDFYIDSLYQFSTSVNDEIAQPLEGFANRVIYDGYSDQCIGSWKKSTRTIYQVWDVDDGGGLFGQLSLDVLAWLFGMARGCLPLSWMTVDDEDNMINQQEFTGITSIMNYPYGVDEWDEYNIYAVNYEADKIWDGQNVIHQAFPASMGIVARSALGVPLSGATIDLYGIEWHAGSVDGPPVLSGTTDDNGEFVFPENPFKPDTCDGAIYGNMLVSAVYENDTAYTWLPINEVGIAYFKDPMSDFRMTVNFDQIESNNK